MVTISVGIPAYRNPVALDRALRSVAGQRLLPHQVIVSDDSPGVGLEEIAQRWASELPIDYRAQKHNLGVVGNKRWILEKATGSWLAFLEHDDYWVDPDYLELVTGAAAEGVSASLSDSYIQQGDSSPRPFSAYSDFWPRGVYDSRSKFVKKLFCMCRSRIILNWSGLAVDRELALAVGAFDSRYVLTPSFGQRCHTYPQEEDMACLALLADRRPIFWTGRSVAVRVIHDSNFSAATNHPGRGLKNDVAFFVWLRLIPLLSTRRMRRLAFYRAVRLGLRQPDKSMVPVLRGLLFPRTHLLLGYLSALLSAHIRFRRFLLAEFLKLNSLLRARYPDAHRSIKSFVGTVSSVGAFRPRQR